MSKGAVPKLTGWLLASLALALAGIVTLAGAGPRQSRASAGARPAGVAAPASSGSEIVPGIARAEVDTLDLQLD